MKSKNPLQIFFDNQVVGMMEVDTDGRYIRVNQQWLSMIGYTAEEFMSTNFKPITHPDDLPQQLALDQQLLDGERSSYRMDKRYIRKDGTVFWGDLSVTGIYEDDGTLTGMVGLVIDITPRKQGEYALAASEIRFRTIIDNLEHIPIQGYNEKRQIIYWNTASTDLYGYSKQEALGKKLEDLIIPAQMREKVVQSIQLWLNESRQIPAEKTVLSDKDGNDVPVFSSHIMHTTPNGEKELFCVDIDLRMLQRAEKQLLQLAVAIEQSGEAVVITDPEGTIEYVNPTFTAITGYTQNEAIGEKPCILSSGEHSDELYAELWETITQGKTWKGRFVNKKKDGSLYTEKATISPVIDKAGNIVNYIAIKRDITDQLLTEEKYRHSQKMEAVGQLAGGVAHDFNNMLAIILGQVEIALMKIPPGDPLEKRLQEIRLAANRSSNLTQQLLGFARKQSRQPQILDLNDTVADMLIMLKRLIGEHLELRWMAEAERPLVDIDPSHFDQILTNLIINARDAIEGNGVISVRTKNVMLDENFCQQHPGGRTGRHVLLTIADTGCGMAPEIMEKIFDPFFTTKGIGKGTGLGLSMVFGLIKQNNGYIIVNSTPGEGSSFDIYFPLVQIEAEKRIVLSDSGILVHGNETVLVVEDESSLLDITINMLTEAGYTVLSAHGPFAAIQQAEKYKGPIHLLLTDIVMPKMNGVELSEYLKNIKPGLKILYMSGYPRKHFSKLRQQNTSAQLLKKPFSLYKLTQKVRDVLDSDKRAEKE
jgi:PAS domain S-box-containing protein